MLPKNLRIKISDFNKNPNKVFKRYSNSFGVYIKDGEEERVKFTISIPKSTDKRSTKRNQTRRFIERIILSLYEKAFNNKEILIRAKRTVNKENNKELTNELETLFKNEFSR